MAQSSSPKIKLLLADVDGTLVTDQKVLTERAQAAVRNMRARGIHFAVTSGRPPRGMAMLIEPLKLDVALAGFNGGVYVNPDLSIIEERTLPGDVARRAVEIIEAHGMDVWLYSGNDWFIHDAKAPHVEREQWTVKFEPEVVRSFAEPDLDRAVQQACAAGARVIREDRSPQTGRSIWLHPRSTHGVLTEIVERRGG